MFNTLAYLLGSKTRCPMLLPLKEVYKKVIIADSTCREKCIAVLSIPFGARRHQDWFEGLHDKKCRASRAKVLRFETFSGQIIDIPYAESWYTDTDDDGNVIVFKYEVGKTVKPTKGYYWFGGACASGIHFFRDRQDAVDY